MLIEARAKVQHDRRGNQTIASHLVRAAAYDAAAADIKDKLASTDPSTVHPVFAALATCAAGRFVAEADEARAKLNNRA